MRRSLCNALALVALLVGIASADTVSGDYNPAAREHVRMVDGKAWKYTSRLTAGHDNGEIMHPASGFDGGVGDFDRYVAQLLFFLAGYDRMPCDSTCLSLPDVDERDHIVPAPVTTLPATKRAAVFTHGTQKCRLFAANPAPV